MNNFLFTKIFNAPFKKCRLTKSFFPMTLMVRLIEGRDGDNNQAFIPDCIYSNFENGYYVLCDNNLFQHFTTKIKHPILPFKMTELVLNDLIYCNKILLRKLISNGYCIVDEKKGSYLDMRNEFIISDEYSPNLFNINPKYHFDYNCKEDFILSLVEEEIKHLLRINKIEDGELNYSSLVDGNRNKVDLVIGNQKIDSNLKIKIKRLIDINEKMKYKIFRNCYLTLNEGTQDIEIDIKLHKIIIILASNILKYNFLKENKYFLSN